MSYFEILNLDREPFSNSPEPEFFFEAPQHVNCLQQLEISIRLRRGLNVVIGDVGTGKTTLSRMLIRKLHGDGSVEFHLLMDPDFGGPIQFLAGIARMMGAVESVHGLTEWQLKEAIKQHLFRRGVDEDKVVVLIIDEGQKLPGFCIEILREFLNYETNRFKLLQIVLFAQPEFNAILERRENFADRMNVCLRLRPLDFTQMRRMIEHRIAQASQAGHEPVEFTLPALAAIYTATGGVPRKVVMLCHQVILAMIVRNRSRAGWFLVQSCLRNRVSQRRRKRAMGWGVAAVLVVAVLAFLAGVSIKRDGAVDPGDRAGTVYQARISDKTVHPLASSTLNPWHPSAAMAGSPPGASGQTAGILFRKNIPRDAAGVQPGRAPGPD
ncbi:MAG TPA: AAA family ATPase [Syntrophales bacterium]|nr:AAA family ATPase [Syntrophales bacterium]HOH45579.1 AAA family ATPase [Syntrophales bacterium]